ncbi:MAG: dolichyl-phosphate beta-glucosyltransferase [Planctomycetota bacterium]
MGIRLSVVIPAFNEAKRLPPYLAQVRRYLGDRYPGGHEVIVVDDGSTDQLSDALSDCAGRELILLQHDTNRGKGAAVRTGMLAARGERLLFADADGAAPIDDEVKLAEAIDRGADVAIGSRLAAGAEVARHRSRTRALVGRLFAALARRWLRISVRDTQCGFKMFRREAGRKLFASAREARYLFDLELLMLADRFGYRVAEVPINWCEVPGGNLRLKNELGRTLVGLWRLRRRLSKASDKT